MASLSLQTIWFVPLYALLGMVSAAFWSPGITRRSGPRPAGYINIATTLLALIHSLLALVAIAGQPPLEMSASWLNAAGLNITFDIEASSVTIAALVVVAGLNLLAQIYAIGYLEMDWGWARFYSLMALFEAGICALILCNSLFFSYVLLEILTLGTYLLIGFWFNQSLVVTGARDAFLTKRVGDLFLLMGVVSLLPLAGTWNFDGLAAWAQTATLDPTVATLLVLAAIAGPIGKCAQFPLHLWLDEAMEGPLPATILRNAIVVCTGAWVLIKLEPVLELSPVGSAAIVFVGATTAIGASLIAIAQVDIKRVLSYVVSAYMGLAFVAIGTGQIETAYVLLLTYAIAMGLLVMSAGGIVLINISQDITQYGGLWSRRPISGLSFLVGAASLVAVPPLGGFWTMLRLSEQLWSDRPWLLGIVLTVNALTAFGLARAFCWIFGGRPTQITWRSAEGFWLLTLPTVVLAGLALHVPLFLWQWSLLPDWGNINRAIASLLAFVTAGGLISGSVLYLNRERTQPSKLLPQGLQDFFARDLYTAQLYRSTVVLLVTIVSRVISWCDRYLIDGAVNLVGFATVLSAQGLRYNTSGRTQFYALTIVLGIAILVALAYLPFFPLPTP